VMRLLPRLGFVGEDGWVAVISGRGRKQLSWPSNVQKMGCIVISDGPKEKNQSLFISSKEKGMDSILCSNFLKK
jgi:hypothetical protein